MTLLYRRLTYITFIIIFLIAAPLVVLYTEGYRYNFKRGKVQKTGMLIISSVPRRAQIYLNDKLLEGKNTPARIEKLLPADYEIKLAKDGYHDWQKKLPVYEKATTFAEKIILWKKNRPIQISSDVSQNWQTAPDYKKIAIINQKQELIIFNLNDNNLRIINKLSDYNNPKIIGWSNTSKKILIEAKAAKSNAPIYLIFNLESLGQIAPIQLLIYQNVKWDLKNDNTVYGASQDQTGLWQINLFSNKSKQIISDKIDDFLVVNGSIYTLKNGNLYRQQAKGQPELIEKTNCANCRLVDKETKKIILLNQDEQNLFLIDPENKNKVVETKAKNLAWLDDDTMLFYDDWEIWIFDLTKKQPELVTRLGTKIQSVIWHPQGRHLIFASDNKIKIIELDNRELKNVIELAALDNIDFLTIDEQGKNLYFAGKLGKMQGIFKLSIQ